MYKYILITLVMIGALSAKCSEVPQTIRQGYATDFYQAFLTQCHGKSTAAYAQFRVAYEAAKNAGESIQRLQILEQLFAWYRMYGTSLELFYKNPTGHDRIVGEHKKPSSQHIDYQSEWGKDPEQAATIRQFMLGVAETISGVLCVSVGSVVLIGTGIGLLMDGSTRMVVTLNSLWAEHQKALIALKEWEERSKKIAGSD